MHTDSPYAAKAVFHIKQALDKMTHCLPYAQKNTLLPHSANAGVDAYLNFEMLRTPEEQRICDMATD